MIRVALPVPLFVALSAPALAEDCTFHTPTDIVVAKELMITDLSVVNDRRADGPSGAWSFGGLMQTMAPKPEDAGVFAKNWLRSWQTATSVNGFPLEARPDIDKVIIAPWMKRDGAKSLESWTINFANAPFRLLAIVYRPDLGVVTPDNKIADAGEGRLVFTALDLRDGKSIDQANPLPFTVIFEYGLKATDRNAVKAWAEKWHALGPLPFGDDYNARLQAVTDAFSGRGSDPSKPSGNALDQLRTDEAALAYPWQLREFHLDASGALKNAEVKNTPDPSVLDHPQELSDFIRAHPDDDIPSRFIGGKADIVNNTFEWPAMELNNNNFRHNFAMKTCNGCHGIETGPKQDAGVETFRQIGGRKKDAEATLSAFLSGTPEMLQDPTGKIQTFCDLKIRQKALQEALNPPPADAALPRLHPDDLSVARSRRDRSD
jgi:hypothetical protein